MHPSRGVGMNEIFVKLINMSISASIIIALIILLRVVLKRMPKKYICILWALVAIRLLCPVAFETSFSAFNIVDNRLDANNLNIANLSNDGQVDSINKGINSQMKNIPAENSAIENSNHIVSEDNGNDLKTNNSVTNKTESTRSNVFSNNAFNVLGILEIVWLLGIGVLSLYALVSYINLKRKVSASINIRDNIYICDYINTPFILGVIKPKIYVQSGLTDSEMDFIIAHEQAHIKRLDYIWKPLGYIILTVYCFNPLCFAAYVLLCRDIEMACDEKVIKNMDKEGTALYSEILLKCSVHQRTITACPIAFGKVGAKKRIKNILSYKKPALWIAVVSSVICVIVAVCFLTDAVKEDKSKSGKTKLEKTVSDKEFWKDNNVFVAELTRYNGESKVTKRCVGLIQEKKEKDVFKVTVRCNFNDYYDNIDLGTYRIKDNRIEKVIGKGEIAVWSDTEIKDKLNKDEKGQHTYVKFKDDYIISSYSDNMVDSGYYEHHEFGKDKILIGFESGYGAEKDLIRVEDIKLTKDRVIELIDGIGKDAFEAAYYDVDTDNFSGTYQNIIAKNGKMVAYMKDTRHVEIVKMFSSKEPREYIIGASYEYAVPIRVVEKAEFINDEELKITYHADDGEGDYIRTEIINTKMYTDEKLEKLALDYYYKEEGFAPPIVDVEYVSEDNIVTIHLYEIVMKPKPGHTATWGWYYIDRSTGKGKDFFEKEVDLNSEVIHIDDKAILRVLKNEEQYYDTYFGKKRYFKDYKYALYMYPDEGGKYYYNDLSSPLIEDDFSIDYITQVDMDGDGKREVVLSSNKGERLVFHSEKGQVYLFAFPFRQMKSINIDGKFEGSSSGVTTYVGKIRFAGKDCYYEELCYVDEGEKLFKLNGEKVKKEEAIDYLLEIAGSYRPMWLKYKENNIK